MSDKLDIIIFGVTGYTGLRTIPYLTNVINQYNLSLSWGVAGRSEVKIKKMLKEFGQSKGVNYDNVPIIIADINDENSLKNMTSQARIVLNATGPYYLYGEQVVKACLASGTHHVDLSGESLYTEKMQLLYHEEAKSKGIYIISACGLDSIPVDMGIVFLKNNFQGTLNSVETYTYLETESSTKEPLLNVGTYNSVIYALANFFQTESQRKKLFHTELPTTEPKICTKLIHKSDLINKWCTLQPDPDAAVARRSQHFFYDLYNERPIQVNCYLGLNSFWYLLKAMFLGFWIIIFSQFNRTRNLLFKYPSSFSNGLFTHEGPSEERQEGTVVNVKLRGKGWWGMSQNTVALIDSAPNKEIIAKVSGRNPGYGLSCATFAISAITILTESDKMPSTGGVYPPGVAFAQTTMIEKLHLNGVKFELISKN
ncbi:lipid droplet localized protein-like [Onthophagus taurus]|uniref:lipid droplet localized protein-like n=1 Tax=Onthophagus taurus TaxID=166361 RepID=UPI0039BEBB0B